MKLYPIKCSCGSTRATKLTDKLANCVVCANPHDIQDVDYYTYKVEPLHDIMEQRAKDKALEDIHQAIHLELWLEEQSPLGVDWSTCFDTDNIRVAI